MARRNKPWMEFSGKKVLLIIAHPDDECMFFGPVIADVGKVASSFSLLCLSKGNYYNQLGDQRKKELFKSCKILGISNVTTLDNRSMVDNPEFEWNEHLVSEVLLQFVRAQSVNIIITFDGYGVSGHKNHISIYKAMKRLVDHRSLSHGISVYTLDSVMLLRKYIFVLDVLWSFITRRLIFVSGLRTVLKNQKAMAAHKSQYVWYRKLYIIFSRYMVINTLTKLWGDDGKTS